MFKKSIGIILTLCMLIGTMVPVCADNGISFKDVPNNSQYKDGIKQMSEAGIIKGFSEDTFGYEEPCTRAQFITFLYRAAGSPDAGKPSGFTDVSDDAYYSDAISWAYNNEIAKGFEDNTFGVDMTVDRSHAVSFLYQWAKVTGNGNIEKSCYLSEYADADDIDLYARAAYAWAVADGIADVTADNKLEPKADVTRAWAAGAIAKLWGTHYHKWAEYKQNDDGTHTRVCELDASHIENESHTFNKGELTKAVSANADGEITYTCTKCKVTKTEKVPAGTEVITRKDLEQAIVDTAWAYYVKGPKLQYDSTQLSSKLSSYLGGLVRLSGETAPEVSTTDLNFYSVCSQYSHQVYWEGLNMYMLGDAHHPFGIPTFSTFTYADNQININRDVSRINDPLTEGDVDACVMRYINYDLYEKNNLELVEANIKSNIFESDSFTDYTTGLQFKNDGTDGKLHYSYYDAQGNKLDYKQVRDEYVLPFIEDYENSMRMGDVITYIGHTMVYIGNNTFLHCNGTKVSRNTPSYDNIEKDGAIFADFDDLSERLSGDLDIFVITRPTEFVTSPCFDKDPGNDIVDISIPENTKSRMKHPLMDIDRTVDVTNFGTMVSGEDHTYTIEISNKTNDEKYLKWFSRNKPGKSGEVTYKDIKVTETIPEGTELVQGSITGGGTISGGVITWNLTEIKPGETTTLSYKVKVTAPVGSKITNGGGMVDNIPSNELVNTVGAKKLSDSEKDNLEVITKRGTRKLVRHGKDTAFANSIYKSFGKELNLPEVKDIVNNLFTIKSHIPGNDSAVGNYYTTDNTPVNLFVRQTEVPDEYKAVKSMIIDRYWGGDSFFVGEDTKWEYATNAIKDFRTDYLEVGDIIVYVDVDDNDMKNMTYNPKEIVVMVYDGSKLLSVSDANGEASYKIFEGDGIDTQLLSALETRYDLFFALRPSQISE